MFITKTITQKNHDSGKVYYTYRLVRTYRNSQGKVRKETLLSLGNHFSIPENQWKLLTNRIEELLNGSSSLFETDVPSSIEKEARKIVKLISAKSGTATTPKLSAITAKDYQMVDINSSQEDEVRHIGNEHVAYHAACQLGLPSILRDVGLNQKQANIALAAIIARLIAPGSERRAHKYITSESAIDEIIDFKLADLDLQYMYFASDWLLKHKEQLEQSLYARERELFNLSEVITLYDITNTYFEGHPNKHKLVSYGRSKEKRSDCELISLGLLLDGSGFPKKSKLLPGNISEPSTLQDMLLELEGNNNAIVIMDAGIATKENIEYLTVNNYKYIVVKRDSNLVMPDAEQVLVKDTCDNKVTVSLVNKETTVDLYCHSSAKEAKVIEFTNKTIKRFEEELIKLNQNLPACHLYTDLNELVEQSAAIILANGQVFTNLAAKPISLLIKLENSEILPKSFELDNELTSILAQDKEALKLITNWNGQLKSYSKVINKLRNLFSARVQQTKPGVVREYEKALIRIGKLKQQYKSVAHLYEITISSDSKKKYAIAITFSRNAEQLVTKQSGIYCLTSNVTDLGAETLWKTYTMLTEIESAFRSLKSELGMRPVYHQLERRIDGHIFITLLAYHLLHTIRYQLKQKGINTSWDSLRQILSMQIRSTTSQDLQDGGKVRIRKTSTPTVEQVEIYTALDIALQPLALMKTYFRDSKL